jgi:hypothetical protein
MMPGAPAERKTMKVKIVLDELDETIEQEMDPAVFGLFLHYNEESLIDLDDKMILFEGAHVALDTNEDGTLEASGIIYGKRMSMSSHRSHMASRKARLEEERAQKAA